MNFDWLAAAALVVSAIALVFTTRSVTAANESAEAAKEQTTI
jgi:hypothetical protein